MRIFRPQLILLSILVTNLFGADSETEKLKPGLDAITCDGLLSHIKVLASDEFDEVKPDWDLSGAVKDVQLLFLVSYDVANGNKSPEWKPGNEFKPKRDAMTKK